MELFSFSEIYKLQNISKYRQKFLSGEIRNINTTPTYLLGYKICLQIYLNGYGICRNTHVSVFFIIMKHDYDDLLEWPFKQKVSIIWHNQIDGTRSILNEFTPENNCCFQRPIYNINEPYGFPKFIPLSYAYDQKMGYIVNDTAFIEVMLEPS